MKKVQRVIQRFIVFLGVIFTSCNFNSSLKDYLELYTSSAAIHKAEFPAFSGISSDGIPCIDSLESKDISLYLRNPKAYQLTYSYNFNYEKIRTQYLLTDEITYLQTDENKIAVISLKKDFLERIDNGNFKDDQGKIVKDISGLVGIKDDMYTGQTFDSFPISLMVNSAPTRVRGACFQMNNESNVQDKKYVVSSI